MAEPIFLSSYDGGKHNSDLPATVARLDKEATWKDLSCVIVSPLDGRRVERHDGKEIVINGVPPRIVASWLGMMKPPNNRCCHLWAIGAEVGEAYSRMVEQILGHPELGNWKYLLSIEHDNAPPSDGMVKLLQRMEEHPEYAAIGGLYFTKGPGGVGQIWGDPLDMPFNFRPQKPDPNGGLVECNGTGMGFTMYRLAMFRDPRLRRPWFKTASSANEGAYTQDLYFATDARKHGYRFAVDCAIRVGHLDSTNDVMW